MTPFAPTMDKECQLSRKNWMFSVKLTHASNLIDRRFQSLCLRGFAPDLLKDFGRACTNSITECPTISLDILYALYCF